MLAGQVYVGLKMSFINWPCRITPFMIESKILTLNGLIKELVDS